MLNSCERLSFYSILNSQKRGKGIKEEANISPSCFNLLIHPTWRRIMTTETRTAIDFIAVNDSEKFWITKRLLGSRKESKRIAIQRLDRREGEADMRE